MGMTTTNFPYSDDDELTATSGGFPNSYFYNANGEQTGRALSGTAYTLAYDYDGQLTSISQGGTPRLSPMMRLGGGCRRTKDRAAAYVQLHSGRLIEKVGSDDMTKRIRRKNAPYPRERAVYVVVLLVLSGALVAAALSVFAWLLGAWHRQPVVASVERTDWELRGFIAAILFIPLVYGLKAVFAIIFGKNEILAEHQRHVADLRDVWSRSEASGEQGLLRPAKVASSVCRNLLRSQLRRHERRQPLAKSGL